ncbi:MerR family transcriptional regulator [Streptomyces sp. BBFR2]|uniref:MerR family transcriptional regulator n=1 Tax=Streptomyces sp. BBFR2 TaxID=3372854 RepID=UPI0037DA0C9A
MKIGELSRRTGVSVRSLRYYEQKHMLASRRTPGGHREYPEAAVDRVVLIQQLLAAGLCGEKIADILPCMRDHDGGPAATATPWLVDQLRMERTRIDRSIQDLYYTRDVLDEVIATAADTPRRTPAGASASTPTTGSADHPGQR